MSSMSNLFSIFAAYLTMSEGTLMDRENDDRRMVYDPSMSIVIWLIISFSVWIVVLLLCAIL
jgi:hypothetical protein